MRDETVSQDFLKVFRLAN